MEGGGVPPPPPLLPFTAALSAPATVGFNPAQTATTEEATASLHGRPHRLSRGLQTTNSCCSQHFPEPGRLLPPLRLCLGLPSPTQSRMREPYLGRRGAGRGTLETLHWRVSSTYRLWGHLAVLKEAPSFLVLMVTTIPQLLYYRAPQNQ